jgi:uncharacterized membrane protein
MSANKIFLSVGIMLILSALFLSATSVVHFLRGTPATGSEQALINGAWFFKVGLLLNGITVIFLSKYYLFEDQYLIQNISSSKQTSIPGKAVIILIVLTAFSFRFYGLNAGPWFDEIMTYAQYAKQPFGHIVTTYDTQNNHILYSLISHVSLMIFGDSIWSLRLPAALFGVGSILLLYYFTQEVSNVKEALFSSALLTVSYHHVWFSQNARGYTGLLFWTILSSWLFLKSMGSNRSSSWLLYAVSLALGIFTHLTMMFVVFSHFIIYLLRLIKYRKRDNENIWKGFWIGYLPSGLFTFQLYALVIPQMLSSMSNEGGGVDYWRNPLWTLFEMVRGLHIGFAEGFFAIVPLLIFLTGLLSFIRHRSEVAYLFLLPSFIGTAVIIGIGHHLWPRFFFFTAGFAVLILVRGTFVIGNYVAQFMRLDARKHYVVGFVICTFILIASLATVPKVYGPKQDFKGAMEFINKNMKSGDSVVTVGMATLPYKSFYKTDWSTVESIASLDSIREFSKRVWLVYTMPVHLRTFYPDLMGIITKRFKTIEKFYGTLNEGTVYVSREDCY